MPKRRMFVRLIASLSLFFLSGCIPRFSNPLAASVSPVPPELLGVWQYEDEDKKEDGECYIHFVERGKGIDVVVVDHRSGEGAEVTWLKGFCVKGKESLYLNLTYANDEVKDDGVLYYIFKISLKENEMAVLSIDPLSLKEDILGKKVKGDVVKLGDLGKIEEIRVSDTSENILKYVESKKGDELFRNSFVLKKVPMKTNRQNELESSGDKETQGLAPKASNEKDEEKPPQPNPPNPLPPPSK